MRRFWGTGGKPADSEWAILPVAFGSQWRGPTRLYVGATRARLAIAARLDWFFSHMKRTASAVWQGSLKTGKGALTSAGGALKNTEYSFGSRFESGAGTNPEELIAAAHAGCFAMALSAMLGEAGITPERLDVTAEVSLDNVPPAGWTVTASHLVLTAKIPGIDRAKFDEITAKAKAGCPISRLLNAKVTLAATLAA